MEPEVSNQLLVILSTRAAGLERVASPILTMHAVLSGLRLPAANFSSVFRSATGKTLSSDSEIADGPPCILYKRETCQIFASSVRSEGSRRGRPRRNNSSNKAAKEDNKMKETTSSTDESSRSSSQEEIIALFKRIQSSISKGPEVSKKRISNSAKETQTTDSVLEALRLYPVRKQVRDKHIKKEDKVSVERRNPLKKTETETATDSSQPKGIRLSRPVSNFVKRSPIPSSSAKEETNFFEAGSAPTTASMNLELQKIQELKLTELKELAKSKGIKGYSKMKKGELLEFLKGVLLPS